MICVAMIWISPCWIQTAPPLPLFFFASFFHLLSLMPSQRRRFSNWISYLKMWLVTLEKGLISNHFFLGGGFIFIPDTRGAAAHQFIRLCVCWKQLFSPQFTATCKTAGLSPAILTLVISTWEAPTQGTNSWLLVLIAHLKKVALPVLSPPRSSLTCWRHVIGELVMIINMLRNVHTKCNLVFPLIKWF